jgi:hypothetical protein
MSTSIDTSDDLVPSSSLIADWVLTDPQLARDCAGAVDPLEIAARLETHGVSNRVAVETFGCADVFEAADIVYSALPFDGGVPPTPRTEPPGGPKDLLRGALYAVPALFLPVVVVGFSIHPHWWVLPIGLTVAWAISQSVAVFGWSLRGRNDNRSDAFLAFASVVISAAVCFGCSLLATIWLGGNEASVLEAVGVSVYIAASGVLLFHASEWILMLCMVPAAIGSIITIGSLHSGVSRTAGGWAVVATVVLVVCAAIRHLSGRHWHRPVLFRDDYQRAVRYFFYGLGCGLMTSVFIGFAGKTDGTGGTLVIVVWPLLLTLGLMEWQLRSFRNVALTALASATDLDEFAHRIRMAFLRSTGTYIGALAVLSAAGIAIGHERHATLVPLLLAAVGSIGLTFFLALMLASSGQVGLVLACWAVTFTVLGTALLVALVRFGHISARAGIICLLVATGTAILILAVESRSVLVSPLSY